MNCFILQQQSYESRWENLEGQIQRLKASNDDYLRQLNEANAVKAKLQQENFEIQRQFQEVDVQFSTISKARSSLQSQVDDLKKMLDDETRVSDCFTLRS